MRSTKAFIACLGCCLVAHLISVSAATPVLDNMKSPHARVHTVAIEAVQWTSGFWAERSELCRNQSLPAMGRLMEGTNYSHFFRNFEIAAGLAEGRHRGAPFNDGDFYKLIEAGSAHFASTRDEFYDTHLDRAIGVISKAQRADGYLHTPVLIAARKGDTNTAMFRDRNNFEVYNLGHLMNAGCIHHRATGKANLLGAAIKAAAFLEEAFANPTPELARNSVCPSHYMGLIELYRETGDSRYLTLAKKFFEMRDLVAAGGEGGDDNQDRVPFLKQTEAIGHAVRANYLYAGATDLYAETGDPAIWNMLQRVWTNMVTKKMYVTGGCGALYDGASPYASRDQKSITRTHQAYGHNYELPNTTAHSETCATIGNILWNWRMFLASGEARYMDIVELALYNGFLSGVSLDGTNYFYTNPLRVTDPLPVDLRWSRTRVPFVSSFCCPPNVVRTITELPGYAYGTSSNALWVNLYGGSILRATLEDGTSVELEQSTEYPWNGRIQFKIHRCPTNAFALKLRIPGWTSGATARINLGPPQSTSGPGSYFEVSRRWKAGDTLDLDLPMQATRLEANPLVEELSGQVAVRRGPVVYCLESVDLPRDTRISEVSLPDDSTLLARFDQRLLGGVAVIDTTVSIRNTSWGTELYREVKPALSKKARASLVPYYSWANREPGEMTVWLQRN